MQARNSKKTQEDQFLYLGRWVNKNHFRVFVYNDKGEELLANSYSDYESLTQSGIWFASKPVDLKIADSRKGKQKNGISSPDGQ